MPASACFCVCKTVRAAITCRNQLISKDEMDKRFIIMIAFVNIEERENFLSTPIDYINHNECAVISSNGK